MARKRRTTEGGDDERKWGSGIPAGSRGGGRGGGGNGIPAGSRSGGGMGGGGNGIPAGSRGGGMGGGAGSGIPAGSRGGTGGGGGNGIPAGSRGGSGGGGGSGIPAGSKPSGGMGGGNGIPAGSRGGGGRSGGSGIPAGSRGGGGGRGGSGIPAGSSVRGSKRGGSGVPAGSKSTENEGMESKAQPATGVERVDEAEGIVEALVSVTGVLDGVGDVIEPGAYATTLSKRMPRGVWNHTWGTPVSKTLDIKELMPGDPDLPKTLSNGKPWPSEAGALWVRTKFNLDTPAGKDAFSNVKFFSEDGPDTAEWSIGYKTVKSTKDKAGTRHIKELDLYEYSPVLHGANQHAKTLSVKSLDEAISALHEGGYDTSAIEDEVKTVEAQAPDPEGLTLAEIKQVAMARDILDAYLEAAGEAAGYGEKRAAPVGDPDLEEPDESWLDDEGHDSSDVDGGDVEVIPTLAQRLEEVLDEEDYAELLEAADAFDEAVGAMDDDAIAAAVGDFLAVFEAEEADDPEDVETWDGLREVVADTFDEANYHVYGIVPDDGDEDPDAEDEYEEGDSEDGEDEAESEGDDAAAEAEGKKWYRDGDAEVKAPSAAKRHRAPTVGGAAEKFPIENADDLRKAVKLRHSSNLPQGVVDAHIKKHANRLDLTHLLPDDMKPSGKKSEPEGEYKGISKAERDKAAKDGSALSDGSFPIRSHAELMSAIKLRHQGSAPNKVVDDHIKKRARALKKTHLLPEDLRDGGSDDASENSDGSEKNGMKSLAFSLPPLDWAERAAFAVVPEIKF